MELNVEFDNILNFVIKTWNKGYFKYSLIFFYVQLFFCFEAHVELKLNI